MKADRSAEEWEEFADALAFLGNSLLLPISMTAPVGLDPAFWASFHGFDDEAVSSAAEGLCAWIAERFGSSAEQLVRDVSVEYTRLFVGPPAPLAPPWETMNGAAETSVGFGEATFQMKQLIRDAGLAFVGQNRQYEDHMGIELLYASELARRIAAGESGERLDADGALRENGEGPAAAAPPALPVHSVTPEQLRTFLADHPLKWIGTLKERVAEAAPDGYYLCLLQLADALMRAL